MIVRARAPLRIGLGGGGTDVEPFASERRGAVLNFTIDRHASVSLEPDSEPGIRLISLDYDLTVACRLEDDFIYHGQLDLVQHVVDYYRTNHGLTDRIARDGGGLRVLIRNDAPPGSGLGSSSAIVVALIAALNRYVGIRQGPEKMARTAFHLERGVAGILGGWQDQYAAAYGGVNFLQFGAHGPFNSKLQVQEDTLHELEYSLVFAYVGGMHNSSDLLKRQTDNYRRKDQKSVGAMEIVRDLAYDMREALLQGRLADLGEKLHEAWTYKRLMAEGISTPYIDSVYAAARKAGALGGKLSGAGGGGFMFFFCDSSHKHPVEEALAEAGATLAKIHLDPNGVTTWER